MPETRPPIEYATKADLEQLRQELRADMTQLRLEIRADMAEFRAGLAEFKAEIRKDLITSQIAMTAIFGGLVTILKLFA